MKRVCGTLEAQEESVSGRMILGVLNPAELSGKLWQRKNLSFGFGITEVTGDFKIKWSRVEWVKERIG